MIDYNRLEETLKKFIHTIKYEEGTVEEYAKKLTNYFEAIIEKEFKLVAKGKVQNFNGEYWIGDNSEYSFMSKVKDLKGKNISIYIVEE